MTRRDWVRTTIWTGFVGMLVSLIDPMEGAFIALPFCMLLTYGAHASTSRYRVPLYWALGSMALGVGILVALSIIGGIGGSSGRSIWWGLLLIPYPLGWLAALFLGARVLREPTSAIPSHKAA